MKGLVIETKIILKHIVLGYKIDDKNYLMLATINMPKVQAPFGVSVLHPVLSIQGYNENYMKYIQNVHFRSVLFYFIILIYS
jgi:hypothetical protein